MCILDYKKFPGLHPGSPGERKGGGMGEGGEEEKGKEGRRMGSIGKERRRRSEG